MIEATRQEDRFSSRDYVVIAIIMGLMGAFFWAIRGTSGFGGSTGGALAGLGWAMLWIGFSYMRGDGAYRPLASGRMVAAIALGIGFGGMTGYGAYISWLNGIYQMHHNEVTRDIAPWTGFAMLFLCGLHWGGVTGAFMSWVAPRPAMTWWLWPLRIGAGVLGWYAGSHWHEWFPHTVLPFYDEGYYDNPDYATSQRVLRSAPNVLSHVGAFLGFMAFEIVRRDWRAVKVMLTMALGFAIPFTVGGIWQTMHGLDLHIDWWKNWEMTIGLGGGLAFGLAFYWFNKPELEEPRLVTKLERIFGVGFILWLALSSVILGAMSGYFNVHDMEEVWRNIRSEARWVYRIAAGIVLAWWIWRTVTMSDEDRKYPLPLPAVWCVLTLIIIAGYVTSIHIPMQLANWVLVTLYTIYIGTSLRFYRLILVKKGIDT